MEPFVTELISLTDIGVSSAMFLIVMPAELINCLITLAHPMYVIISIDSLPA